MKFFNTYLISRNFILVTLWLIIWISIHAFVIHEMGWDWRASFLDALVSTLLLSVLSFIIITVYNFYQPSKANSGYRLVFAIVFTLIYYFNVKWILSYLFSSDMDYQFFLRKSLNIRGVWAFIVLSFITVIHWFWSNMQNQKEQERRKADMEQLAVNAELERLRQQLQPHFLFNSLNSINALVVSKPEMARHMVQLLSDFLRGTIKKDEQKLLSLKEELHLLRLYLEIEKVRFGHRLNVEIKTDTAHEALELPPLLLQPLVENAIKFGLYGTTENVNILIKSEYNLNLLVVNVSNPFSIDTMTAAKGTGFGLNAISRRLYLIYGRHDLLRIETQSKVFKASIHIPQFNTIA